MEKERSLINTIATEKLPGLKQHIVSCNGVTEMFTSDKDAIHVAGSLLLKNLQTMQQSNVIKITFTIKTEYL